MRYTTPIKCRGRATGRTKVPIALSQKRVSAVHFPVTEPSKVPCSHLELCRGCALSGQRVIQSAMCRYGHAAASAICPCGRAAAAAATAHQQRTVTFVVILPRLANFGVLAQMGLEAFLRVGHTIVVT